MPTEAEVTMADLADDVAAARRAPIPHRAGRTHVEVTREPVGTALRGAAHRSCPTPIRAATRPA